MASSSIPNFLSLFTPPKPKTPPTHLSPSSSVSLSSSSSRNRDRLSPIFASREGNQYPPVSSDVMHVVSPSLVYANTMFFDSGYNVQIVVEEEEPEDSVVNRFTREVMRAGVIQECKRRRFFENKQEEKKRRNRDAARRNRRRRGPFKSFEDPEDAVFENKEGEDDYDDDDDNWELPEGDLPF